MKVADFCRSSGGIGIGFCTLFTGFDIRMTRKCLVHEVSVLFISLRYRCSMCRIAQKALIPTSYEPIRCTEMYENTRISKRWQRIGKGRYGALQRTSLNGNRMAKGCREFISVTLHRILSRSCPRKPIISEIQRGDEW